MMSKKDKQYLEAFTEMGREEIQTFLKFCGECMVKHTTKTGFVFVAKLWESNDPFNDPITKFFYVWLASGELHMPVEYEKWLEFLTRDNLTEDIFIEHLYGTGPSNWVYKGTLGFCKLEDKIGVLQTDLSIQRPNYDKQGGEIGGRAIIAVYPLGQFKIAADLRAYTEADLLRDQNIHT